jgi:hypothetical protein
LRKKRKKSKVSLGTKTCLDKENIDLTRGEAFSSNKGCQWERRINKMFDDIFNEGYVFVI